MHLDQTAAVGHWNRGVWSVCLTFAGGLGGAWLVICLMKGLYESPVKILKRGLALVGKASMQIYEYQMFGPTRNRPKH